MDESSKLYLFALEVVPLKVGKIYNPLPSHLTLIPRFYSHDSFESITNKVSPVFNKTESIDLVFDEVAIIGPNHTKVYLVQLSETLIKLHTELLETLNENQVKYTQPEYIGKGWEPHISRRDDDDFILGSTITTNVAYLIEVSKQGDNDLRTIRQRFNLSC